MEEEQHLNKAYVICSENDRAYAEKLMLLLGEKQIAIHFYKDQDAKDSKAFIETFKNEQLSNVDDVIVLIGPETWKHRLADIEIYATLDYHKADGSPIGMVGILLPNRLDYGSGHIVKGTVPPRLFDNWNGGKGYSKIFSWKNSSRYFSKVIQVTESRKNNFEPDNSRTIMTKNKGKDRKTWTN